MHRSYRNNCQNKIGKNYGLNVQKSLPGKRRSHARLLVMNFVNDFVQKRTILFILSLVLLSNNCCQFEKTSPPLLKRGYKIS